MGSRFPGDLPNSGIEPRSPTLQVVLYQLSHQGSPIGQNRDQRSGPPGDCRVYQWSRVKAEKKESDSWLLVLAPVKKVVLVTQGSSCEGTMITSTEQG